MKSVVSLSLILISLLGCQSEKKYEIKTVSTSGFTIDIPVFLKKTDFLHEEASLQYQDVIREYYTLVIEEPIEEYQAMVDIEDYFKENYTADLDGYTQLVRENMLEILEIYEKTDIYHTSINGMPANTFEISGKIQDLDVFYTIAYIEGDDTFYQVVNWTLLSNKKDFAPIMRNTIKSFKEKNNSFK